MCIRDSIDMIIVYKNDRIHRSLYNLLAMIYELQNYEVALVSVTEMFDTSTPQGMLFLQMLGSFAEFERAVINERTRNGRIARLNENKWAVSYTHLDVYKRQFQILCATHSPIMVDISKPHSSLVRVIKDENEYTKTYQVGHNIFQ